MKRTFIFIRQDGKNVQINVDEIYYIEARKNYTKLVMSGRSTMVLTSLKNWEDVLPADKFCRTHRSYIVSLAHIHTFDSRFVYLQDTRLAIGENYLRTLVGKVVIVPAPIQRSKTHAALELVD
jgi:DNA-binding LytR/AlgR family response regulator